ncbi:hypothetical protein [Lactiplantibacillus mudanjiangensis]|uniref:Uncharacterized protein n=1 Tax=Lactiplantibacillus mudanjiangensis TaxID=1296538 RepID=A0A660E1I3_9LACO|nr:hypothetical protein [Lactiplantibacillus mudanjiangensis]VDG21119.1 hypothetical protein [Lactobacillus sp. CBA3605] [Lactiplantibacillus mudanjiangensis]VDG22946.1 hypothetical protein [Lactobacillus sp. CBA3605] [Lactiplantibacillus mudanjiangensis]VDG29196.1 hypothetical protein [Lactobacillus sp. CBA3605] [Lactiplantibacillus mudanjiangensis]VDG31719.1 hypothetical protein [Lactobacillus sp. CBA3605] [Lactiplantibacillus mudanjiangensis]
MLLDTDPKIKNITAVNLVKVVYPLIIAKTEQGDYIQIKLSDDQLSDPLFWESARDLCKNQLWVPMGRKFHQLLSNDWILPTA